MFESGEAIRFLNGELGAVLTISYQSTDTSFRIERRSDNTAEAFIPRSRGNYEGDSFDIAMALGHPACGVRFNLHGNEYQVQIANRHQLYAVLKLALNHFGWHDEQKIIKKVNEPTVSGTES
jgi:hypothetical protein